MSSYNQEFNKDNVILRYVIVSLLAELKDKVYYFNRVDEDTLVKIPVPFYYSVTGNERFLLDNFLWGAIEDGKAIGDYEVVPRGILQLNSMAIDSGSLTNKFVRSEFVKEYQGQLKTYMLETMFLPIDLSFGVTVVCSDNLEMLKVTESIISNRLCLISYGDIWPVELSDNSVSILLTRTSLFKIILGIFLIED